MGGWAGVWLAIFPEPSLVLTASSNGSSVWKWSLRNSANYFRRGEILPKTNLGPSTTAKLMHVEKQLNHQRLLPTSFYSMGVSPSVPVVGIFPGGHLTMLGACIWIFELLGLYKKTSLRFIICCSVFILLVYIPFCAPVQLEWPETARSRSLK